MPTHAELSSKLLNDAATFFEKLAESNDDVKKDMIENANVFRQVSELLAKSPQGVINDKTHAELGARLLKDAAEFFRTIADENEPIKEQMLENGRVFDQISDLLVQDPMGILD